MNKQITINSEAVELFNKRIQIFKPCDLSIECIKRLERAFGPVDMVNDFFDSDLKTYFKTTYINNETQSSTHKVIKLE